MSQSDDGDLLMRIRSALRKEVRIFAVDRAVDRIEVRP
jgi:hypothetical protein